MALPVTVPVMARVEGGKGRGDGQRVATAVQLHEVLLPAKAIAVVIGIIRPRSELNLPEAFLKGWKWCRMLRCFSSQLMQTYAVFVKSVSVIGGSHKRHP